MAVDRHDVVSGLERSNRFGANLKRSVVVCVRLEPSSKYAVNIDVCVLIVMNVEAKQATDLFSKVEGAAQPDV